MSSRSLFGAIALLIFIVLIVMIIAGMVPEDAAKMKSHFWFIIGAHLALAWLIVSGWNKIKMIWDDKNNYFSIAGILLWASVLITSRMAYQTSGQAADHGIGSLFLYSWLAADIWNLILPASEEN
jgi:hypothetical protein